MGTESVLPQVAVAQKIAKRSEIELSTAEVVLIQATCDLVPHPDSPLQTPSRSIDKAEQAQCADALVQRGLASPKTYRPDRELVRRVLIVSQPDARLVMLAAGSGQGERILDVYERAQAMVPYKRRGEQHSLGQPMEMSQILEMLHQRFVPRRSTGDFIDLELDETEYFVFSACGQGLAAKKPKSDQRVYLEERPPKKGIADPTLDGAVLLPGRKNRYLFRAHSQLTLPVPTETQWQRALASLTEKDVLSPTDEPSPRYSLRYYLHDLAVGMVTSQRYIVTRFDFGPQESTVRDATFVPVPGSLFGLSSTRGGGIRIRELNRKALKRILRQTVLELDVSKTQDL